MSGETTEYAVMCADGSTGEHYWYSDPAMSRDRAVLGVELMDDANSCGPHRAVQRTVTDWQPA